MSEEVQIHINEASVRAPEEQVKIWKSCCFSINKEVVVFITQNLIGVLIILFCIFKLNDDLDCSEQQTFISLLTFIVGILLPNPKFTK